MSSYWTLLAVFGLLLVAFGLWTGATGLKRQRKAPAWAAATDPRVLVAGLVAAVVVLVGIAAAAILAPLFS